MRLSLLFLVTASVGLAYWNASSKPTVKAIHESILAKDYSRAIQSLGNAYEADPSNPLLGQHLMSLWDSLFSTIPGGRVPGEPSGNELPQEILFLKVAMARFEVKTLWEGQGRESFAVRIVGDMDRLGRIRELRLSQVGRGVVLDKNQHVGDWGEAPQGPKAWFHLEKTLGSTPPVRSLYALEVVLDTGKRFYSRFMHGEVSTGRMPQFRQPSQGNYVFHSGRPVFEWDDYRSPEFQKFEQQRVLVTVTEPEDPFGKSLWFTVTPNRQRIQYGDSTSPIGTLSQPKLTNGDYFAHLSYWEMRQLGGLTLSRESGISVPFIVRARPVPLRRRR